MGDEARTLTRELVVEVAAYFDTWLALRQSTLRVPGVQAAILFEDEVVLSVAHGCADLESATPLQTDHLFRIASHSKTFTATAVLQLVEKGLLRLDDCVRDRLSWLPAEVLDAVGDVTVRELLSHGGGIIRDGADGDYWQLYHPFPSREQIPVLLGKGAATYRRNEHFKYSNLGYALLGLLIEEAAGTPYNDYVTTQIVQALGLRNTGPELAVDRLGEYASGYTPLVLDLPQRPVDHVDTGALSAATGFYSTAEDLCRYAAAHFHGNDVLVRDDSKRLMSREEWSIPGKEDHYGLGFQVGDVDGRRVVGHAGGYPGHATNTKFDPETRLAVVALTNITNGPSAEMTTAAFQILGFAAKQSAREVPEGVDLDRLTGRFINMWGVMDVVRFGNRIFALWPERPNPTENAVELEVLDGSRVRQSIGDGFAAHGEVFEYSFDGEAATSVRGNSGMTMLPVEAYRQALERVERIHVGAWAEQMP